MNELHYYCVHNDFNQRMAVIMQLLYVYSFCKPVKFMALWCEIILLFVFASVPDNGVIIQKIYCSAIHIYLSR